MILFNFNLVFQNLGFLIGGLVITILLTLIVITLSLVLGLGVALAGTSRTLSLRWCVKAYLEVIRGTPLLLQLIYLYYVLPMFGVRLDAFTAGTLGLTLNYSAYISEVYRSGIEAVSRGQRDAASALGMTSFMRMRLVILPQAIAMVIPSLGNYAITLFKDTALCSVLGIQELMFRSEIIAARNFQYLALYNAAAIMYLVVCFPAARFVSFLERRKTWAGSGKRSP